MVLEMAQSNTTFLLGREHCFRILTSPSGRTIYCDGPVVWKGPWRDVKGEVWIVEACSAHRPDRTLTPISSI
jgi:hypothetical protein